MTTPIFLELKSMSKAEKKKPTGIEEIIYNCTLKGTTGITTVTLNLKSNELKDLSDLVTQKMGNQIKLTIENIAEPV